MRNTVSDDLPRGDPIASLQGQYRVTLMKNQNTALSPTQPYYIASNSAWTPAAQPATQPPPVPGYIQIFGNPRAGQTQTVTQLANTSFKFVGPGVLDLTNIQVVGLANVGIHAKQLQGLAVCTTAPSNTYVLTWSSANNWWCPAAGGGASSNAPSIQGTTVAGTSWY